MASYSNNTFMTLGSISPYLATLSLPLFINSKKDYLHVWFSLNGLALNPDNSDTVLLGTWQRQRNLPALQSVDVAGCVVPLFSQVKILLVTLDSHLTFDKHVIHICKAYSFHMRALRHIRPCLTDDVAKTIASALVSSRLDYANAVLVRGSDKNITKLQRTQNNLAHIVTRKYERRGVMQSLKYLHWLPIRWRIDYKIAVTTYKVITTGQSQYLCSRIERYSHMLSRSLRNVDATHNSLQLVVPATRTVIGTRAFWSAAPDIWNKLPDDIVKSPSLLSFRNKLKTHYNSGCYKHIPCND